uniref:Glutamine cyclotransferase n=1 Tax=Alexandrium catenella TaxID=2925 RepID=A0A7S1PVS5_ALECA
MSCAVEVLRTLPHVSRPFTQGLEVTAQGRLVETSGDFPPGTGSFLRLLDPRTGAEERRTQEGLGRPGGPEGSYFLEGITELGGHWFASTFGDKVLLEYDADFRYLGSRPFPHEGWGLTHSADGRSLLATNSSEYLLTLDPRTAEVLDARPVTCLGRSVPGLNELELVPDFLGRGPAVLGNLINTRLVLAVDPLSARCLGVLRLAGGGLEREERDEAYGYHVANGLAFDRRSGSLFVTGKNWRSLFEVRLRAEPSGEALGALRAHLATAPAAPAYGHR